MKTNEVEKLLNISRANIRFYEKEGLLNPEREDNRYRDYSDADIAQLKRIIIFRKLGIPVSDIRKILNGTLPLRTALERNIQQLQKQIEELNGALDVCSRMERDHLTLQSMDEAYYWNVIHDEEQSGRRFLDLLQDCADFELTLFGRMFRYDVKQAWRDGKLKNALLWVMTICVIRGLLGQFVFGGEDFWYEFFYLPSIFVMVTLIVLPLFLISKKFPKLGSVLCSIVQFLCIGFLVLIGLTLIVLLLNAKLHFWF